MIPEPKHYWLSAAGGGESRIAWPDVFVYEYAGADAVTIRQPFPPPVDTPFKYVVHDIVAFEALSRRNMIRDPRHTGRSVGEIVDERRTPGA